MIKYNKFPFNHMINNSSCYLERKKKKQFKLLIQLALDT
jgi:hypothetical protein